MLYLLAKALEVSGLLTVSWALYIAIRGQELYLEVGMLALGSLIFYVGRLLEGRAAGGPGGRPGGRGGR